MKALVIADDLTGAAEIAGIGWRFGLPVRLLREPAGDVTEGLTVIDTDSRSLSPADAAAAVRNALAAIDTSAFDLLYKKIDSVLRGPVVAEVEAAMAASGRDSAILLPQNPSRGRTIEHGVYTIDGIPLHQTTFAADPEHPATTSNARQRIGLSRNAAQIAISGACTFADVVNVAAQLPENALPVGGADLFTALLQRHGLTPSQSDTPTLAAGRMLLVSGTTSSQCRTRVAQATAAGMHICAMPTKVFGEASESLDDAMYRWTDNATELLNYAGRCVMLIDHPPDLREGVSERLRVALATAAARVIFNCPPDLLLMEGGATAAAVCQQMGWTSFNVIGELSTGVVELRCNNSPSTIVIKPGSYPWPDHVWAMLTDGTDRVSHDVRSPRAVSFLHRMERFELALGVMVAGVFVAGLGIATFIFGTMILDSRKDEFRPAVDTLSFLLGLALTTVAGAIGFRGIAGALESNVPKPALHLAQRIRVQSFVRRLLMGFTGLFTGLGALTLAEFWSLLFLSHRGSATGYTVQFIGTMIVLVGGAYAGNTGALSFLAAIRLPTGVLRTLYRARHLFDMAAAFALALFDPIRWLTGR